jgi:site-specific recombinase XerC
MLTGEREWIDRFVSHLAHERRMSGHTQSAYRPLPAQHPAAIVGCPNFL